ncbi:sigma-70 family RNA polymerase sigma factor [Acidovorax sp. sif1233]|uniref:sigma-70 family RNA polymerase sigma factor n=1 Tax=unclassified Acidovorax TaxID=2684926 RepID=UPI001C45E584|nr:MULTISPECIES: sigma-70 family RNA polymerase sigma factor [unclassified Acidovorax]MBV7427098.1 sigma-70 family RNA polymerase sigma factor [Acidovorax sp. sif0732]MBV7448222.1 sigma-70 family RNA polymerase sigma factor [Acidovorax sp. sif0715]MBV7454256.1 sigma-70 family RNA polymerase sigma factor [Acidovorax sp. sif1233]
MNRTQVVEQLPGLRRYARVLTGDAWAADDLVQDTLERACSKWLLWRTGSDLRAWLFTLMHNLYLNQRRAMPALAPLDIEDVRDQLPGAPVPSDDALDLERCLQRLPADQRAVLLLVAMEDMSYEDTARILAVPVGTVMSRLSRARARLRVLMERTSVPAPSPSPATAAAAPQTQSQPPALRRLK